MKQIMRTLLATLLIITMATPTQAFVYRAPESGMSGIQLLKDISSKVGACKVEKNLDEKQVEELVDNIKYQDNSSAMKETKSLIKSILNNPSVLASVQSGDPRVSGLMIFVIGICWVFLIMTLDDMGCMSSKQKNQR